MKTGVKKFRISKFDRVRVNDVKTIDNSECTIVQILDVEMDYEYADITALVYFEEQESSN